MPLTNEISHGGYDNAPNSSLRGVGDNGFRRYTAAAAMAAWDEEYLTGKQMSRAQVRALATGRYDAHTG